MGVSVFSSGVFLLYASVQHVYSRFFFLITGGKGVFQGRVKNVHLFRRGSCNLFLLSSGLRSVVWTGLFRLRAVSCPRIASDKTQTLLLHSSVYADVSVVNWTPSFSPLNNTDPASMFRVRSPLVIKHSTRLVASADVMLFCVYTTSILSTSPWMFSCCSVLWSLGYRFLLVPLYGYFNLYEPYYSLICIFVRCGINLVTIF